jgi:hypothetical protein
MLLTVSTWAPPSITTDVCVSTYLQPVASVSPTLGGYNPTHCQVPVLSEHDKTMHAAGDIIEQLGGIIPSTASAKLNHLSAIRQLSLIMSGQPNAPTLVPTAPRVETTTPLRVVVAAPPRVATTLNMITSPNTILQFPIVHQHVTRNNNPFQILADDDDDEDDNEMVVASNCSPKMPLPMLHERHGPVAIPPTIPWPTTHCPQVILVPSPPLIPRHTMS